MVCVCSPSFVPVPGALFFKDEAPTKPRRPFG